MKLGYLILYVPDVAAAMDFYFKAFGFEKRFLHDSGDYGEMESGAVALAFASQQLAEANGLECEFASPHRKSLGVEIVFVCDDVESAIDDAVKAGAKRVVPAKKKPWGQTVGYVRDPFGFLVELCTAVA